MFWLPPANWATCQIPPPRCWSPDEVEPWDLILSRPDLISVDAFVPSLIYGLNETCRMRGYRLLMDSIHNPSDADSYLELAKSQRIDGLIVINPRENDAALRKVIDSKFPLVVFGSSGHPRENSIGTKDGQASCGATTHLISLGHRRIAHISYAPLIYNPARSRYEGYRLALKKARIRFDKKLFAEGDFTGHSGYQAMKKILATKVAPTALFAGNDTLGHRGDDGDPGSRAFYPRRFRRRRVRRHSERRLCLSSPDDDLLPCF